MPKPKRRSLLPSVLPPGSTASELWLRSLVDWDTYLVHGEDGSVYPGASGDKFLDHLCHYLLIQDRFLDNYASYEVQDMGMIDWTGIIDAEEFQTAGKFDTKKAIQWFTKEVTIQIEKVAAEKEAEANFRKNMVKAIHTVYDGAGKDILPRSTLIGYVLHELGVPIAKHDISYAQVEDYLLNNDDESFGTILGPSGGTVRCKDIKGKPTHTFTQQKQSVRFGKVERERKGSSGAL